MAHMDSKRAEKISKALSDPTRLKILSQIQKKHDWLYCVDLYEEIHLAQPSICHHLKQLTETSIILPEKEGRNIKYTMNNEVIDDFIGFLQGLKNRLFAALRRGISRLGVDWRRFRRMPGRGR